MEQAKSCYFRCDYIHDLSVQKEFSRGAVLCNALNRYANAAVILILALYYPLMIFLLDAPGEYCRAVLTLAFFYLVFELLRLFLSRGGGIQYKRMVFTHGGEAPRCSVRFLEDSIVLLSSAGKQLYFAGNDGYSCFIFYADADWAQRFTARTGLKLATDIYEIY